MIRALLKKVGLLSNNKLTVIPRAKHGISRKDISENALKVLYRLHQQGFGAYLVGGGVRDLLLDFHPKDFDIVTDAKPEEIRRIFRNCRLIGRRFRLAHIYFGHDIVEVATFRGKSEDPADSVTHSSHGMILRDNVYGTLIEDVWRRDFTINALYYNIADFSLVDHCGGYADLKAKRLRMIGDVETRYREDPVRMLRAIRFASKLDFKLSNELTKPMLEQGDLVSHVAPARLFEEMMKMFHSGVAANVYELLKKYQLFGILFPASQECFSQTEFPIDALLREVFLNTDLRVKSHQTVTPAFVLSALLWYPICLEANAAIKNGATLYSARLEAIEKVLRRQTQRISLPKRIVQGARDIWILQIRLTYRHPKRVAKIMLEQRLRAGVDFLEMRAKAGENVESDATWWRQFIDGDSATRNKLMKSLGGAKRKRKKKPKKLSEGSN